MAFLRINLAPGGDDYDDTNSDPSIIAGNDGDDTIDGGGGSDFILGGKGSDEIDGGNGRDVLYGGRGDDDLNGGSGFDFISGDLGADTLRGGGGSDTFYFKAATADAVDTVTDFSAADKLLLDGFTTNSTVVNGGDTEVYADGNLIAILEGYTGAVTIATGSEDYSDYTPF